MCSDYIQFECDFLSNIYKQLAQISYNLYLYTTLHK